MNKKGFTLIELISIIVLISIVASITFGVVTKKIKQSKESLYNTLIADIEKAGEKYMLEHADVDKYHLNTLCIDIPTLQENDYIDKGNIKNPKNGQKLTGYVKVTYDNSKNQYEFKYSESCTQSIVTPLVETIINNEEIKVVGNTDGLYETTDDYIYRGNNPNNYLSLNGSNTPEWRIISIDKKNNMIKAIKIKDNQQQWPQNGLSDYLNSDYESGSTYESFKQLINTNSKWNTGKIDKLDTAVTIKSIEKQSNDYYTIGLLSVGEYIDASLNKNCYSSNNCSSYLTTGKKYWLTNKTSDDKQWYVDNNEIKNISPTDQLYHIYPVLYLTVNASFNGDGTISNPYK